MAATTKIKVGIIFSDNDTSSLESIHLAKYIGAHLVGTGYATVSLIGFRPGDLSRGTRQERVSYYKIGTSKPVEAPSSDLTFGDWSTLAECQVYISCINAEDSELCAQKIVEMVESKYLVTVFCMQRGVRGGGEFKDVLSNKKDFTAIECVVGFGVVPHPATQALISTTHCLGGNIVILERLTKELVKTCDGPVNLMETMPFTFIFQKTLTTSSWGALQFECIGALHAVLHAEGRAAVERDRERSLSVSTVLQRRDVRLLCAAMIRESSEALRIAAAGGKWKPDCRAISSNPFFTPWTLEMLLVLPQPLYSIMALILGFSSPDLPSPGAVDLSASSARRQCYARHHLSELVTSGEKHKVNMPVCALVLSKLELLESGSASGGGGGGNVILESRDVMGSSQSVAEVLFWTTRAFTVLAFIILFYFLFLH